MVILIKLVEHDVLQLPIEGSISILVIFVIAMVSILFIMGLQPKRNSIFELKLSLNPLFPAANIFACIYLMSELNIVTWIRYIIWMLIGKECLAHKIISHHFHFTPVSIVLSCKGIALYIIILKMNHQRRRSFDRNANNNVFMSDHNHTNTTMTEMEEIAGSVETLKPFEDGQASELNRRSTTPDVIPKMAEFGRETIESTECQAAARAIIYAETVNSAYLIEEEAVPNSPPIKIENQFVRKLNECQCNGFDDIEIADDVKICCIEKREPNGKVYFVDMDLTESSSPQTTSANRELKTNSIGEDIIIQEIVDRVLFPSNRKIETIAVGRKFAPPPPDDAISEDESEVEDAAIETRAIVHTIIDVKDVELADQSSAKTMDASEKKSFFTFGVYRSPANNQNEQSTTESIGRSKEFRDRLTQLLGQYSEEPMKLSTSLERKRSISIPENINTASMIPDRRPSLKLLISQDSKSGIPAAPKFDQLMYNTVGRRMKMQQNPNLVPATAMSIENEFAKSFDRLAPLSGYMHRTKKSDDLMKLFDHETEANADVTSVSSIKERLNEIYGRGRPPIAPFNENDDSTVDSRRNSDEGIQLRKPIKPYDTVHKQKQLFSDVLKSINPEVRNSLHRTESIAKADVIQTVTYTKD